MTRPSNLAPEQTGRRSGDAPRAAAQPPRSKVRQLVKAHPLASFFVLSCLFSWWPSALAAAGWSSSGGLAGFGPFLAAVLVLALAEGRGGVRQLLVRMVRWRVGPRAYLLAIGIPVVITGAAVGLTLASGAAVPSGAALGSWTQLPLLVAMMLLIPGVGGAWEEPGFRGFALGRLEERFGISAAPLLLGGFWVVWHLPLFLTGDILWPDVVVILAVSVVIAAVYHSARESILIAMLLHATNNAVAGEFASPLFTGVDAVHLHGFIALGWVVAAVGVMTFQRVRAR